jgi:predicted nucleotidyltransferase
MQKMDEYQRGLLAVKESIEILKEKFADKIYSVILYGSLARGEKNFDDIDILILPTAPLVLSIKSPICLFRRYS